MRYFDYSPMYYHTSFWPQGLLSLLFNVLIWGVIAYLFIFLFRKMARSGQGTCCGMHEHEDPSEKDDSYYLHIAKERYVKGEIDKKQFDEMKKSFSGDDQMKEVPRAQ